MAIETEKIVGYKECYKYGVNYEYLGTGVVPVYERTSDGQKYSPDVKGTTFTAPPADTPPSGKWYFFKRDQATNKDAWVTVDVVP